MNFNILKDFVNSLTDWIIPGNSVVVYKDNEKVFEYSSGYADIENKIKMDADKHLFIYSCSKVATVVAALQLIEAGKMSLDDPLYKFLPEYKNMTIRTGKGPIHCTKDITIWNLFTMTAGFSYTRSAPWYQKALELTNGKMDTLSVFKCHAEEPLYFEPSSNWSYSLCHDVLAGVIEVVSGMKFSEYVIKNVFLPLGMTKTVFKMNDQIKNNMAQQYVYDVDEEDIVKLQTGGNPLEQNGVVRNFGLGNTLVFGDDYESGGAGVITTVNDYAKLAMALANYGVGMTGERILKKETVELLKTNQLNQKLLDVYSKGRLAGYGYGLGVRTMLDVDASGFCGAVGEFGWGGAAGASIFIDCEQKVGLFYAHHMLNPQEDYYQPRLRDALYKSLNS